MGRVILQAGGRGTRLLPYTSVLPKPLMPVGEHPIVEIMIRQLVYYGFPQITITLGHLAALIEAVVGDGRHLGAEITYVREYEALGTIGPVRLVEDLDGPFLVMNGDLLTDFNYRDFFEDHIKSGAQLSVGLYRKPVPISLGVFEFDENGRVNGFKEKPTLSFPCSMGIYAFRPDLVELIPQGVPYGFDHLMAACLSEGVHVHALLHDGIWLDIGRHEDYDHATEIFNKYQDRLVPGGFTIDLVNLR
ncbi:MAG TPA: sugar phosphate nucleotidyltransferase [Acidimicrobiia bacterium]|nr:sugar phosphate nucleotidyltransferase [Acidimicrobiia bacterium]